MAELIELDDALRQVQAFARSNERCECSLEEALGKILAAEIVAVHDSPPYDKSMVDGYAVIAADLADGPRSLEVTAVLTAGQVPERPIARGQAARIMTGAPLPAGADAVVMLEQTRHDPAHPTEVQIESTVRAGQNMMVRGQACRAGRRILERGQRIRPVEVGLIAEAGRATVPVVRPPRVALIQTGNELVAAGEPLAPGQITNSNGPLLAAMARQAGAQVQDLGAVSDHADHLSAAIGEGLTADVLVVSGGVSAGDLDLVPGAFERAGVQRVFHKVKLRPGKPLWFGAHRTALRTTLVFGLPGNPVSSLVCFRVFVTPVLLTMAGHEGERIWSPRHAQLMSDFQLRGARATYWPARVDSASQSVVPLDWLGSADPFPLARSDCLILFAQGERTYRAGERVPVLDLDP